MDKKGEKISSGKKERRKMKDENQSMSEQRESPE